MAIIIRTSKDGNNYKNERMELLTKRSSMQAIDRQDLTLRYSRDPVEKRGKEKRPQLEISAYCPTNNGHLHVTGACQKSNAVE